MQCVLLPVWPDSILGATDPFEWWPPSSPCGPRPSPPWPSRCPCKPDSAPSEPRPYPSPRGSTSPAARSSRRWPCRGPPVMSSTPVTEQRRHNGMGAFQHCESLMWCEKKKILQGHIKSDPALFMNLYCLSTRNISLRKEAVELNCFLCCVLRDNIWPKSWRDANKNQSLIFISHRGNSLLSDCESGSLFRKLLILH